MWIVVEGCGQWAMQYFNALKNLVGPSDCVFFTFDSTFGLDLYAEKLPADLFLEYLQATLSNVRAIRKEGFDCIDVKDTLFKGKSHNPCRKRLPYHVDAVFVVTPPRTHCDVGEYWLGRALRVFVEKPFDVSTKRIQQFCKKLRAQNDTEVFAVDHYFVRCNQAAADENYFLNRLLTAGSRGSLQGDITAFEFRMTEPALSSTKSIRERALSIQDGMVFDMGSHALPVLIPFIDINKPIRVTKVWAGVSERLRDIIFSGAETFSAAQIECHTRSTASKPSSQPIVGKFVIGKDIGDRPEKYLRLEGPGGKVKFDLVDYCVYHKDRLENVQPVVPLQQDWVRFFVKEVLEGRTPRAVEIFEPEGALKVIKVMEDWRSLCQSKLNPALPLPSYKPGEEVKNLQVASD